MAEPPRRHPRRLRPSDENALHALETRDWLRVCGVIIFVLIMALGVLHLGG